MFRRTGFITTILILALGIMLGGCGGSGNSPEVPASTTAATMTFTQRQAAMNAAEAKLQQLSASGGPMSQNRALATYMRSQTQYFANAKPYGANDNGGVIARFIDGQLYVICNDGSEPATAAPEPVAAEDLGPADKRSGVPAGKTAILMRAMGNGWPDSRPALKAMLVKAGYTVVLKEGTIENLRAIRNPALFYFDTHGEYSDSDLPGTMIASAWTTTPVTAANDAAYASDLSGAPPSLVRWSAKSHKDDAGKWVITKRYAITHKFIERNGLSFGKNSFVYMDCCYLDAAPFKQACLGAGASLYAGWTNPVGGRAGAKAAKFVFDRLTGANSSATDDEDPDQRPFDYVAVRGELSRTHYDTSGTAKLVLTPAAGDCGMLAPSIKNIEMHEATELNMGIAMMTINGLFGNDPGAQKRRVTVGDHQVNCYRWEPTELFCELPRFGEGSVGDVVVEANNHKSNAVPLTEWTVNFTYTRQDWGGLTDTLHMNIHLRADVHSYRTKPHVEPTKPTAVKFLSMVDSDGNWSSTGTGTDSTNADNPIRYAWSGSGMLFNQTPPPLTPPNVVRASGKINVATRTIQFTVSGAGAPKTVDAWDKDNHHTQSEDMCSNEEGYPSDARDPVPYVKVKFDENFKILGRTLSSGLPDHPETSVTLQWNAAEASFPPLPDMTTSSLVRLLDVFWRPAA